MGLDMYLYAVEHTSSEDMKAHIAESVNLDKYADDDKFSSVIVKVQAMYWRKAWAIHNWFSIGNGEERYVSNLELQTLVDELNEAIAKCPNLCKDWDDESAGKQEYLDFNGEELHWSHARYTVERLTELLSIASNDADRWVSFYYSGNF